VQKYNDNARLFTAALEELQGQLELIESGMRQDKRIVSSFMKEFVEKVGCMSLLG